MGETQSAANGQGDRTKTEKIGEAKVYVYYNDYTTSGTVLWPSVVALFTTFQTRGSYATGSDVYLDIQ